MFEQIKLAVVVSDVDLDRNGSLVAKLVESDVSEPISVSYTSPFLTIPEDKLQTKYSGFFGTPNPGTYILVAEESYTEKWYYISTLANPPSSDNSDDSTAVAGESGEEHISSLPGNAYELDVYPQEVSIKDGHDAGLTINAVEDKSESKRHTQVNSATNKRLRLDDANGYIDLKNEHGDGIKITDDTPNEKYVPGPGGGGRSIEVKAKSNVFIESDSGNLGLDVRGGYQLNIANRSMNNFLTRPIPFDTKVGEVNVESYANSINIKTYGNDLLQGGPPHERKGIFIDASQYAGVVQIRAGRGGVEIWSHGDIDFNCAGNFNVNAGGDINLKGKSAKSLAYWPTQSNLAPPISVPGVGNVNLNPPTAPGVKPLPTLNNDEQWPIN